MGTVLWEWPSIEGEQNRCSWPAGSAWVSDSGGGSSREAPGVAWVWRQREEGQESLEERSAQAKARVRDHKGNSGSESSVQLKRSAWVRRRYMHGPYHREPCKPREGVWALLRAKEPCGKASNWSPGRSDLGFRKAMLAALMKLVWRDARMETGRWTSYCRNPAERQRQRQLRQHRGQEVKRSLEGKTDRIWSLDVEKEKRTKKILWLMPPGKGRWRDWLREGTARGRGLGRGWRALLGACGLSIAVGI